MAGAIQQVGGRARLRAVPVPSQTCQHHACRPPRQDPNHHPGWPQCPPSRLGSSLSLLALRRGVWGNDPTCRGSKRAFEGCHSRGAEGTFGPQSIYTFSPLPFIKLAALCLPACLLLTLFSRSPELSTRHAGAGSCRSA